jgi:hypothetical protein
MAGPAPPLRDFWKEKHLQLSAETGSSRKRASRGTAPSYDPDAEIHEAILARERAGGSFPDT